MFTPIHVLGCVKYITCIFACILLFNHIFKYIPVYLLLFNHIFTCVFPGISVGTRSVGQKLEPSWVSATWRDCEYYLFYYCLDWISYGTVQDSVHSLTEHCKSAINPCTYIRSMLFSSCSIRVTQFLIGILFSFQVRFQTYLNGEDAIRSSCTGHSRELA